MKAPRQCPSQRHFRAARREPGRAIPLQNDLRCSVAVPAVIRVVPRREEVHAAPEAVQGRRFFIACWGESVLYRRHVYAQILRSQ